MSPQYADQGKTILVVVRFDCREAAIQVLQRLTFDRPCGRLHEPLTARFLVSKVKEALGDAVRPVQVEVSG